MTETTEAKQPIDLKAGVSAIIGLIDQEREREIITRRFGLYDRRETLEQIGELLGITRERVRPEININTSELCPSCNGTGTVVSSMLLSDNIEEKLTYIWDTLNISNLKVVVNPIIKAYLTKGGFKSVRFKWLWKFKKWVKIQEDNNYHLTNFNIYNDSGDIMT